MKIFVNQSSTGKNEILNCVNLIEPCSGWFSESFCEIILIALSPFVLPQCHNSHTEAPTTEERCSSAVEAAVCVCPRSRVSELFTGLACGPLLTVNQVCKFRSCTKH